MKSKVITGLVIVVLAGSLTACGLNRTQQNTLGGAAVGGLAGNWLGGDMGSTLGGAALGGVIGSQLDRGYDDHRREKRKSKRHRRHRDDD